MTKHLLGKYASRKESGIDLIQEIPEHWLIQRVKDVVIKIGNGVTPRGGSEVYQEEGIPFLRSQNVHDEGLELVNVSFISPTIHEEMKNSQLKAGDILFNITGASIGRSCIVPKELEEANISQHVVFLRVKKAFNKEYISLFLKSNSVKSYIRFEQNGASKEAFTLNQISTIPLVLPEPQEQQVIADYLETKTAQIDRKIELLEQKAEKYTDLKKSLISETVTHGLDKIVKMKDSGVDWLGQIPEHWEVKRISDIASKQKIKNIGLREKNLLSLSYGRLKRKDIEASFGLLPESFETYQIVNKGNIILRLTDLQNDWTSLRVGLARERGIITSAYLCLRFSKLINPEFAYYVLHVYDLSKVFYWLGSGLRSVMKFEDIKVLPFILPPLEEQRAIADYLEAKTAHIEKIIETINLEVEKLKELRKTLINDVVTGKIKVYQA